MKPSTGFLLGALMMGVLGSTASRVETLVRESIHIKVADTIVWHYGMLQDSVLGQTIAGRIYGKNCGVSRTFARPWRMRPATHDSIPVAGDSIGVIVDPPCRIEVPVPPNPTPTDSLAEPVFDPTKQTMLYNQNFDKYTLDSLRPPCGSPVGTTLVDHSIAFCTPGAGWTFDGNVGLTQGRTGQAVTMSYSGVISAGGQEIHGWIVGNPGGQTGRSMTFVQYWMRFVSDSGTPLTSRDANGMSSATVAIKNVMLWNDQNRFQWDFVNGPPCHHADGSPWYGPIGYTSITGIETGYLGCNSAQPVGPSMAEYGDGAWHRWTLQYKPMSVPGATDGVSRLWIDGKLVTNLEKGACAVPPPTPGWKPWCDVAELAGLVGGTTGLVSIEWGGPRTDGGYTSKWTMIMDDLRWWKNP
jgi:hypothetical protein